MKTFSMNVSEKKLSDTQIKDLARPLVGIVKSFYDDPEHRKGFEKWLQNREDLENGNVGCLTTK